MKSKRLIALLLVVTMVTMIFAGCNGGTKNEDVSKNGDDAQNQDAESVYKKINVCIPTDPGTLAPWAGATGVGKGVVYASLYETLFVLEELGGEMYPRIASGYEQIDDLTYRISIYDNVYDAEGNHITADDVVFSYKTANEQGNMATFLSSYQDIAKVDDYTVDLTLNSTALGGLMNTTTYVYIVDQEAYEADPDGMANEPVSTGPYKVSEWVPGSSVILVKNDKYWQIPELTTTYSLQNVDEIEYKVITEASQMTIALQTGEVDFVADIAQADLEYFGEGSGFKVLSEDAALTQSMLINCSDVSPTNDKLLRQSICYAIDSQALVDGALDGVGSVCMTFGSPVYGDYLEKWDDEDYYNYNPEKAMELLELSSYDGETLTIMSSMLSSHKMIAQIVQAYLLAVGINAEIVNYDDTLFSNYRWDPEQWDIQIANKGSGDYVANIWRYSFDQSFFGGQTQGFYTDETMQELLVRCLDQTTHNAQNMDAFHQYLKDICVGYGLIYGKSNYVYVDSIDTVVINPQNAVIPGACTYAEDFSEK
ncbi:MAG: ABC transporter substrate-binding protein [Eubacteriales bacterium]